MAVFDIESEIARCLTYYHMHLDHIIQTMDTPDTDLTARRNYARQCVCITPRYDWDCRGYRGHLPVDPEPRILEDSAAVREKYGWSDRDLTYFSEGDGGNWSIIHARPTLSAAYRTDPAFWHGMAAVLRNQYNTDPAAVQANWPGIEYEHVQKVRGYYNAADDIAILERMIALVERDSQN